MLRLWCVVFMQSSRSIVLLDLSPCACLLCRIWDNREPEIKREAHARVGRRLLDQRSEIPSIRPNVLGIFRSWLFGVCRLTVSPLI